MPNTYALTGSTIVELNSNLTTAVTGVSTGETLVGIDFRPQNGLLYGLGVNAGANTATLYAISTRTGVATAVGAPGGIAFVGSDGVTPVDLPDPATAGYGFDFNPAVDRIRVTTDTGLNFRLNPNTGAPIDGNLNSGVPPVGTNPDGSINGPAIGVSGTAYTNNAPNTTITTQYTLDAATNQLFIQSPPNAGTQTQPLPITLNGAALDFTAVAGFDIAAGVNAASANTAVTAGTGLALLQVGGITGLYSIDLTTGAATQVTSSPVATASGLAIQNDAGGIPAVALSADGTSLVRFNTATPGTATTVTVGVNVAAGETLVGLDFRPHTGQLYALGVNAATNTGTLYLVDPQGGAATAVGTPGGIAFVNADGTPVDLPDPATAGYGFDFNPSVDRIRVTTETGLNLRLNPNNGAAVDGNATAAGVNPDGAINGLPTGSTGISATAYTNSFGQNLASPAPTTLYTLDTASNALYVQNPANAGTQAAVAPITLNGTALDFTSVNGFDIPNVVGTGTAGYGVAALTVGGSTGLYRISLETGAATLLGSPTGGLAGLTLAAIASAAPVITSNGGGDADTIRISENTTAVTTVTSTDADGPNVIYSIAGGADAARFTIDAATGALAFAAAPDFEAPASAAGTNAYAVTVRVNDGTGAFDQQALTVQVGDVNGAPNFGTLVTDQDARDAGVIRLYDTVLNRAGDLRGLELWSEALESGASLSAVAASFVNSAEFASRFGTLSNDAFVDLLYANALGRDSDADAGAAAWRSLLDQGASRADVAVGISESFEHRSLLQSTFEAGVYVPNQEASVAARFYYGVLDRAPDAAGLQGFVSVAESGASIESIANAFVSSAEFQGRYGTLTNREFVDVLYDNALGRDSDLDPASQGFVSALDAGASRAAVAIGVTQSVEATNRLAGVIDDGLLFA